METRDKFWELSTGKIFHELSPDEEQELMRLLEEGENGEVFESVEQIHEKLKKSHPLQNLSLPLSWKRISTSMKVRRVQLYRSVMKYAAILLVAFLAGILVKSQFPSTGISGYTELKVPLGQMSEVTLSDGTHIWLNSGTTLKYPNSFGDDSRDISLDGEAFFKVEHSKVPFVVKLKKSEVEVLGTSFNVVSYAEENSSQVTLVEGSVQINTLEGKAITRIKPSEQINIPDNLEGISIRTVNTDFYSSWIDGKIEFDEERLADIAFRLERWYNVKISFTSKDAENLRFSGTILKNKPFDQIIKAISLLLPVEIKYKNNLGIKDEVIISKIEKPM
ncbi:FecR domain-containing protein [Maribellus sp. CM-23]|uniref:FecR family protein n=1 Tax=Maribellus sp. CM-23 TaxID=2781026 RepID=UPI001F1FC615|nr:FecR domain-containing protein [Maribellus sp. CM-23]MCE4563437.1 FecR domain-containing protein [Maribellus sp. CM-23]